MTELKRFNTFIDSNLTEDQLKSIANYTSFNEMKARNAVFGNTKEEDIEFVNQDVLKAEGGFLRQGNILF